MATGDVDLTPDDLSPTLHLKATRGVPLSEQIPERPKSSASGRSTVRPRPVDTFCQSDAAGEIQCYAQAPDANPPEDQEDRELTEGDIVRAVREIGLPSLAVLIQPGEETLVNIPTIFYTRPQAFERSVALLGFDIDLTADPVSYRWIHGDGTTATTSRPGAPYPAMEVTHRYRTPAESVRPRVDVTYRVHYRVDGGGWQTVAQTLQAVGPASALAVEEAAPVLTKP